MVQSATEPSGISLDDYYGVLVYIEVLGVEKDIATKFGLSNAVKVNLFALDNSGREEKGALIFPRVLQSQLGDFVGQSIVGTLSKGEAKAGQSPPWKLMAATPEQVAQAQQFEQQRLAANAPATVGQAPAGNQWQAPTGAAPTAPQAATGTAPTAPSAPGGVTV